MSKVTDHNRDAWNEQSRGGESRWVQPVDPATIARAREGDWSVILTPTRAVPRDWFGEIEGTALLGLASGGGQQVPVFAAAGARVTSFDNSDEQLAKDRLVAEREDLDIRFEQGDMADLSRFDDDSFDLVFHPVSNLFAEAVRPVWRECARVLKPGGRLLAGFMNPDYYLFDHDALEAGAEPVIRFGLPYSDVEQLSEAKQAEHRAGGVALEFSHSLDDQIGGQLEAGFVLTGFFEDRWSDSATPLNRFMPTSMATCAVLGGPSARA